MTNHTQIKRKPKQTISRATNHLLQLEEIPKDKLQRAIDTKQNLTPTMVMAIQRTLGNKAATKIVQQQNPNSIQRFTEGDLLKAFDKAYNEVLFMLKTNYDVYSIYLPENHPFAYDTVSLDWTNGGGGAKDMLQKAAEDATLGEIPHFLRAVEAFKISPDFATGQDIYTQYVAPGSDEEINISGKNRNKLGAFFGGPTGGRSRSNDIN